jgi:hypothetical protein
MPGTASLRYQVETVNSMIKRNLSSALAGKTPASRPDRYRVPPHTHPKTERITVIAGTFNIGMGKKFDPQAMKQMPAGTYGYWPAGMAHFVSAKGETVLQFHGTGPWAINYRPGRRSAERQAAANRQSGATSRLPRPGRASCKAATSQYPCPQGRRIEGGAEMAKERSGDLEAVAAAMRCLADAPASGS